MLSLTESMQKLTRTLADADAEADDFAVQEGVELLDRLDMGVRLDDTVDDIVGATVIVALVDAGNLTPTCLGTATLMTNQKL
jgi:hypothetical protein